MSNSIARKCYTDLLTHLILDDKELGQLALEWEVPEDVLNVAMDKILNTPNLNYSSLSDIEKTIVLCNEFWRCGFSYGMFVMNEGLKEELKEINSEEN